MLFAVRGRVALDGEREAGAEPAGVAPGDDAPDRDARHARQLLDATRYFLEEVDHLRPVAAGRRRYVDRQHLPEVEARSGRLQGGERGEEHAGAGEEHEREGDLGY